MRELHENPFADEFIPPITSVTSGIGIEVLPDLFCLPVQIVNVCFLGNPKQSNEFVLIDAGMPNCTEMIIQAAKERFGENCKARALILTHGHFDHVGSLMELIELWHMPIYVHELEIPYITGKANYPPADPSVDSGLIAKLSPMFPHHGITIGNQHVKALPKDGAIPSLSGWRWIHTPGHTPGHISLFRESDGALIAGDAFVTVKQESLYKVLTQEQEISGPPKYFTTDWEAAEKSVRTLAALHPTVAVTGHGLPLAGQELTVSLQHLTHAFRTIAVPQTGRYVH